LVWGLHIELYPVQNQFCTYYKAQFALKVDHLFYDAKLFEINAEKSASPCAFFIADSWGLEVDRW
jgi:hypothetical protein